MWSFSCGSSSSGLAWNTCSWNRASISQLQLVVDNGLDSVQVKLVGFEKSQYFAFFSFSSVGSLLDLRNVSIFGDFFRP